MTESMGRRPLHVMRERDVGLFSLVQQVVANIPWALGRGRVPIADFRHRCCYWTPEGHESATSVWEYYFEPVVAEFPADCVPAAVTAVVEQSFPDQNDVGFFVDSNVFVTNHYGDHPSLHGLAPAIPYEAGSAPPELRRWTSRIMREHVRPRDYIRRKAATFFDENLSGQDVIGVHVRGTDAVSAQETRAYRQGSLDLDAFVGAISRQLDGRPQARILVATDAQSSLQYLIDAFGIRVVAYHSLRHREGEAAGTGPTGMIMPAYISRDRAAAARNGEDAVVELLLLGRCSHLVHNGAGLAMTVLLQHAEMTHTNTHSQADTSHP